MRKISVVAKAGNHPECIADKPMMNSAMMQGERSKHDPKDQHSHAHLGIKTGKKCQDTAGQDIEYKSADNACDTVVIACIWRFIGRLRVLIRSFVLAQKDHQDLDTCHQSGPNHETMRNVHGIQINAKPCDGITAQQSPIANISIAHILAITMPSADMGILKKNQRFRPEYPRPAAWPACRPYRRP